MNLSLYANMSDFCSDSHKLSCTIIVGYYVTRYSRGPFLEDNKFHGYHGFWGPLQNLLHQKLAKILS